MRRLFLVILLLAMAGTAGAIDIKGKWGLGVGGRWDYRFLRRSIVDSWENGKDCLDPGPTI